MDRPSEHFGAWGSYMRRQGLSAGTIKLRRYELWSWDRWIVGRWDEATFEDVEGWISSRPLGPKARQSAVSHLRMFYRWARREHLVTIDPCADVVTVKCPRRSPRPATPGAVSRAVGMGASRAEVASALMAYAGLRCCEVAVLEWDDVDLAAGWLHVRGKGGHERPVPIAPPLASILAVGDGHHGPVIAAVDGGRLSPHRVGAIVSRHLRGLGCRYTPHQLRHFAATHVGQRSQGNLLVVRDFLGHASVATTEIYTQLMGDAVAKAVAAW